MLAPSRPMAVGMGGAVPLPIPYGEISRYARDMGLARNATELAECVALVRAQDDAYLEHAAATHAEEEERRKAKEASRGR